MSKTSTPGGRVTSVTTKIDNISPASTFGGKHVAEVATDDGRYATGRGHSETEAIANATRKALKQK
jgi:hypothetical protein